MKLQDLKVKANMLWIVPISILSGTSGGISFAKALSGNKIWLLGTIPVLLWLSFCFLQIIILQKQIKELMR